jgi:Flp pilus assembly pilin Flp
MTPSAKRQYIGKGGQTAVEYLLTTVALTMVFAGMYGFMQKQLTGLYRQAAKAILTSYGHQ